jgi:hypothetical protein
MIVGGPKYTEEICNFYYQFTMFDVRDEIKDVRCKTTVNTNPTLVLAITPPQVYNRSRWMYSWEFIFNQADIILTFGDWNISEIYGTKPDTLPYITRWSGDNYDTMDRILSHVNKR